MANLLGVHPEVRRRVLAFARAIQQGGIQVRITSGYRSVKEQQKLFENHQRFPDLYPLPVAKPGCSTHNYGLAVDMVMDLTRFDPDFLQDFSKEYGLIWAGARDHVHWDVFGFERWNEIAQDLGC